MQRCCLDFNISFKSIMLTCHIDMILLFFSKYIEDCFRVDLRLESDCDKKEMTKKSIFYVDDS